jgi:hypothetical protein
MGPNSAMLEVLVKQRQQALNRQPRYDKKVVRRIKR